MPRSWTIGSKPDCDLVVSLPSVSGHHCRLVHDGDACTLEDLASTNGTYVNGQRITGKTKVSRADVITLGQSVPMPWPAEIAARRVVLRIGREPDNDVVLNQPMVSGHHARIVWDGKPGEAVIEDLGSSNGTALGAPDRKIARAPVTPTDTVFFGSFSVPAEHLFARLNPSTAPEVRGAADVLAARPFVPAAMRLLGLLVLAPFAAVGIIVLTRGAAGGPAAADAEVVATAVFWLSLCALWLGLLNGLLVGVIGGDGPRNRGAQGLLGWLALLMLFCFCQCAILWAIASGAAALRSPTFAAIGWLVLVSAVGAALGLLIAIAFGRPPKWAAVGVVVLATWLLGGHSPPMHRLPAPARAVASIMPSRWAFEGLLLLEARSRDQSEVANAPGPAVAHDLAEPYFPVDWLRMGGTASALALALMLIGLCVVTGFLARGSRLLGSRGSVAAGGS